MKPKQSKIFLATMYKKFRLSASSRKYFFLATSNDHIKNSPDAQNALGHKMKMFRDFCVIKSRDLFARTYIYFQI